MGMYDQIEGLVKCPYCGETTTVNCQIKWLSYSLRKLKTYHVGDDIPCVDAIYTGATTVRPVLTDRCEHCNHSIRFTATVKDSKLSSIDTIIIEEKNNNERS